jgi:hypothetical protein
VPINFHEGIVSKLVGEVYSTLIAVAQELVQNSVDVDAQATKVWVLVNYITRELYVRDNGLGISIERFNEALGSVAEERRKGKDAIGQFGRGLLSPQNKCEKFIFTSCPAPHLTGFNRWTFNSKEIMALRSGLYAEMEPVPNLTLEERPKANKTKVTWRSEMRLVRFTKDTSINRISLEDLANSIRGRYGAVLRRRGVTVNIKIVRPTGTEECDVTARDFLGTPLPEVTLVNADAGSVVFKLYQAGPGGQGVVHVGVLGNDFRFPFKYPYFARSASGLMGRDVVDALSSGFFEGEILCEKVELHPDRDAFHRNDALIGMQCAIEEWWERTGSRYYDETKQQRQEERWRELGDRSRSVIERLLQEPANRSLLEVLLGGPARKESLLGNMKPQPTPKEPSTSTPKAAAKSEETQKERSPRQRSAGLAIEHTTMEGSDRLWKFDRSTCVLTFNIRHPLWVKCDKGDGPLMNLQEFVALQALTLETMPEVYRTAQRDVLDALLHSYVVLITNDVIRRGKGGRESEKTKE